MKIETLDLNGTNCYLISTDIAAVVIDPAIKSDKVKAFLEENAHKDRLILITHAHFDHIGDGARLQRETAVKVAIGELDNPALSDLVINEGAACNVETEPFSADILIKDGDVISVGDLEFKAIHSKGHTIGGICYYINDVLFSGDILFYRGFGNTVFHGGNKREIFASLIHLFNNLPLKTVVYPGHGRATTIGDEKEYYGR